MPRYERGVWLGKVVWEIEVVGTRFEIRYGKARGTLETYARECASHADAKVQAEKLIAQRIKDGYKLASQEPVPRGAPVPAELELQLRERPDDDALLLVYADWLQGQGDPRGELIAHAAEDGGEHRAVLLGPLAHVDPDRATFRWRRGFLDDVSLAGDRSMRVIDMLVALCEMPDAYFVRTLRIGIPEYGNEVHFGEVIEWLAKHAARLPRLRALVIGDFEYPDETELSWANAGDVSALYAALPALERIEIQIGGDLALGAIDLPALRHFEVRSGGLDDGCIQSICNARWPKLEALVVWFGDPVYGAGLQNAAEIAPMLAQPLRHLGLCNAAITNNLVAALRGTAVAATVEALDLSRGTLDDDGADALASLTLPKLRTLDVSDNFLTERGFARLAELGIELVRGTQKTGDDRYPSVGE